MQQCDDEPEGNTSMQKNDNKTDGEKLILFVVVTW